MIKHQYFVGLVALVFFIKVAIAFYLPLGNDEVYYLTYARYPSYHYYDHPLLVGWFLKVFSLNLLVENTLLYRLFSLLLSLGATVLVYRSMLKIATPKAAKLTVLLFLASLYNSVVAGLFIMPDAPMLFFWVLSVYLAILTFFDKSKLTLVNEKYFIPLCFSLGLTFLSKFHAVFLVFGILGFITFYRSQFLKKWTFWEGILVLVLFTLPVIIWNYYNNWVQFSFYANRTTNDVHLNWSGLSKELIGQVLYNNPIVFAFIIFFGFISYNKIQRINKKAFLLWISLPFIFFIVIFSLFKETLPHWSGSSYVGLIMLAGLIAGEIENHWSALTWVRTSFSLLMLVFIAGFLLINYFPGTLSNRKDTLSYGSGDFTLDMYGWDKIGLSVQHELEIKGYNKLPIVADNWFPGAHIDEYIARPNNTPFFLLGDITKTHHYQWVNDKRGNWRGIDSAIVIVPSNYYRDPSRSFQKYFNNVELVRLLPQYRNGELVRYFHIYLLTR